jgi:hypothetical protein
VDVTLDLETLGTTPDSVILTIGMIKFDPYSDFIDLDHGIHHRIDFNSQIDMGRFVSEDTLRWWSKQDPVVVEEAMGEEDRIPLNKVCDDINRFLVGAKNIWCQGPHFDICMLENLYRQLERPIPWNYWQISDSRTFFKIHGDPREVGRDAAHNALMDCYYQSIGVQQLYKKLGITK